MGRKRQMPKWYPAEYQCAEEIAHARIQKVLSKAEKLPFEVKNTPEGREQIHQCCMEVIDLAFTYEIDFNLVIHCVDWLYLNDFDTEAFETAKKLFDLFDEAKETKRKLFAKVCDCLEEIAYERDDTEELLDRIVMARVHNDLS